MSSSIVIVNEKAPSILSRFVWREDTRPKELTGASKRSEAGWEK